MNLRRKIPGAARVALVAGGMVLALLAGPGATGQEAGRGLQGLALDREGKQVPVRLAVPSAGALRVEALDGGNLAFDSLQAVSFPPPNRRPGQATPPPPPPAPGFRVGLGRGQFLSGSIVGLDDEKLGFELEDGVGLQALVIERPGITSLEQRSGEVLVLSEEFESIESERWVAVGGARITESTDRPGEKVARIPAGGASLKTELETVIDSGRLELLFGWTPGQMEGHQAAVVLDFEGPTGPETIRVLLGWGEEFPGVLVENHPTLVVQPLVLSAGWHRLSIRFRADRTMLSVDGDLLASGAGPTGRLRSVRLETTVLDASVQPGGLALEVDQARLVRFIEPASNLEIDPSQDEIRQAEGDQVWGKVEAADHGVVRLEIEGESVPFGWPEVAGVYFKRAPGPSRPLDGQFLMSEWEPAGGLGEYDRIEGAFVSLNATSLVLETAHAGAVRIPTDRLRRLVPLGRGRRISLDVHAHHLGDQEMPDLDPPRADSDRLEVRFELDEAPALGARLAFDVIDVEGEYEGARLAEELKAGHLLTEVYLNDQKIGTLNSQIRAANLTVERIGLSVSPGVLKEGENVLRLSQTGRSDAPKYRDDLGVLGISLEWPSTLP